MNTIKTGIIGTGFIGPAHVEALRRLGYVDVVAVAERGQELAEAKAAALWIPKAYGDYRQLLADPQIQVVHNCTPNHLHFEINKEILAAGKHIVSEKPLAMSSAESRELVRLATKAGVVNAIDFNYRYMPLVQQAHQMCQARWPAAGARSAASWPCTAPIYKTGCCWKTIGTGGWYPNSAASRGPWPTSALIGVI